MQQRQYRPGDVLDDYCPRERRVTGHAIVAMIEDEIQRTRCVSCDTEHAFKHGRVPAPRKKSGTAALFSQVLENLDAPAGRIAPPSQTDPVTPPTHPDEPAADAAPMAAAAPDAADEPGAAGFEGEPDREPGSDDRPFRRSLIRAQLPRHDGQAPPTRAIPEFTMHQPQNNRPHRGGHRFRRPGGGTDMGGPMRSGHHGGHGAGNSAGQGQGQGRSRRRRRKKH
jgi:hypothetical protein